MINSSIRFFLLIFLLQINIGVAATSKENGLSEELDSLKDKVTSKIQSLEKFDVPRPVPKGRMPEIVIVKDEIYFNGKKLWMGAPLDLWKNVLSGRPRCSKKGITICVWEEYGLQVGTDESIDPKVDFLNIYMRFSDEDGGDLTSENYPRGKENLASDDWHVHEVFPGYLELDGHGIDAKSKFWEIRSGTKTTRNLRCGIRECSSPRGAFGDHGVIQLRLDGSSEGSTLRKFSISRTDRN